MSERIFNVLFLCTGNSARSIFGEVLMNHYGRGKFRGYSAGSHPKGEVHPYTLELLQRLRFSVEGLRSKDWNEFAWPAAPHMDFVFTVCDRAAAEPCPVWPGQPISAHWGVPDPVAVEGGDVDKMMAFRNAFRELENRISIFSELPVEALERDRLKHEVERIGGLKVQHEAPRGEDSNGVEHDRPM